MKKVSMLEVFDIETGEHRVLREFEGVIEAPNWLADGDTLLYNADGRLFLYSIGSNTVTPLVTGALTRCNNDHVPSADGRLLGISCCPPEEKDWTSQIYLMPLHGGPSRQVTKYGPSYLHGITHDGSELTYCAFRNEIIDIYTISADGGEEKRLTDGVGYNDGPEYSPDDRHIWFNSTRCGLMQIFRMNRDGSELCQMTETNANNWFPHVSPDGSKVVYLSFREGDLEPWQHLPDKNVSLWMMDYDGSHQRKLLDLFGGQGTINVNSWAPDSRRFAFVSYRYDET